MQANKKQQSHNLTHEEHKNLKYQQQNDEQPKVEANKDSNYLIPEIEQHLVHATIEVKTYNTGTGAKTSVERLQSFYPAEFKKMEKQGAFTGMSVNIVHEPSDLKKVTVAPENKSNLAEGAFVNDNSKSVNAQLENGDGVGGPIGGTPTIIPPVVIPPIDGGGTKEKTLSQLDKAGLKAKYKEVWGEDASEDMTNNELREAIKEKLNPNGDGE